MKSWQILVLGLGAVVIAILAYFLIATPAPNDAVDGYNYGEMTGSASGTTGETSGGTTGTSTNGSSMNQETTTIVMQTTKGDITIELYTGAMPVTAGNFLKLVNEGFYNGVKFHRVIPGFMIQGGDPLTKDDSQMARWGTGGPGYTIKDEFGQGLSNVRGTLSMANAGPNTGGSQFFINVADNTFLDPKHPVFGRVTAGMEVADAIVSTPTAPGDRPQQAMVINKVVVQ